MTIEYGLRVITPASQIETMMLTEIAKQLNKRLNKAAPKIKELLQNRISSKFTESPVYRSLTAPGGNLRAHFGLDVAEAINKLDTIIDILASEIEVEVKAVKKRNDGLIGGLNVFMFKGRFDGILNSRAGFVTTEKGQDLHWLRWLTIEGNKIIVSDYDIEFGPFFGSRSGAAIMIKDNNSGWRVPPEFSGTITNNWITRLVKEQRQFFSDFIGAAIQTGIEKA